MNRFNLGNQTTNGVQILSIAGRTAAGDLQQSKQRKINDLSSGLNNLSESELKQVGEMRANALRKQVESYNYSNNNESDAIFHSGGIDELMEGHELKLEDNSAQIGELQTKVDRDVRWNKRFANELKGD